MYSATTEIDRFWDNLIKSLLDDELIDDITFNNGYSNSRLLNMVDSIATIQTENKFQKLVLESNIDLIQQQLKRFTGELYAVRIVSLDNDKENAFNIPNEINENPYLKNNNIRPEFTFDSFIVGDSNRYAKAAAYAVANNPGKDYNPLFIYGNSGLGKTHLINAIGNLIKINKSNFIVKYTPCNEFVDDYVSAIKDNKIDEFTEAYRNIDILLIDDIQFLAGKEKSHEVFFNLFNWLVNNRKQIVITSDRHPNELENLKYRLVSRFSSGLTVGIDTPEFETALAILKNKLKQQSAGSEIENIDDESLNYIASRYNEDIRKLEGAMNRILFYSICNNYAKTDIKVTLEALKDMDSGLAHGEELTLEKIKTIVANYYGLTKQQIVSKQRTAKIANARHIAIYLSRKHLDVPFSKIGDAYGKRDHSTIMSSYEKINKLLKSNNTYSVAIKEIEKSFTK